MSLSDAIRARINKTVERLGESISLNLNGTLYQNVSAVITNSTGDLETVDSDEKSSRQKSFRFVLPAGASVPVVDDLIIYKGETWAITSVISGYRDNYRCLAERKTTINIGKMSRRE